MLNRYYGWYVYAGDLAAAERALEAELTAWAQKYDKPIIITEYGADTLAGLHDIRCGYDMVPVRRSGSMACQVGELGLRIFRWSERDPLGQAMRYVLLLTHRMRSPPRRPSVFS